MVKTKYVTIESTGKIAALGGLTGPITTPTYLDINIIITLINSGKVVYEVNPSNIKEKIRLTRQNVLKHNFTTTKSINKNSNTVHSNDVGLTKKSVSPSSVTSVMVSDKNSTGPDLFISNKRS